MELGTVKELGHAAAASGWRQKAADAVAPKVARSRLPAGEGEARALIGLAFLALSVKYLVGTFRRVTR